MIPRQNTDKMSDNPTEMQIMTQSGSNPIIPIRCLMRRFCFQYRLDQNDQRETEVYKI